MKVRTLLKVIADTEYVVIWADDTKVFAGSVYDLKHADDCDDIRRFTLNHTILVIEPTETKVLVIRIE